MRKSIGVDALVVFLLLTGCIGGIGPLNGGESLNDTDTDDGLDGADSPDR